MADGFVSVSRRIEAPAEQLFALLADSANHPLIDGSGMVREPVPGVTMSPWPPPATSPPNGTSPPSKTTGNPRTAGNPGPPQAARLLDLIQRLNITLEPVAQDSRTHAHAEDRYVPSRKLRHLLNARNRTCTAPACNAQAVFCDLDHTVPYPDGPTCECNLTPKCRRHHRTKQAPGWETSQPTPGTNTWTTPSGRTHTTGPTIYDL